MTDMYCVKDVDRVRHALAEQRPVNDKDTVCVTMCGQELPPAGAAPGMVAVSCPGCLKELLAMKLGASGSGDRWQLRMTDEEMVAFLDLPNQVINQMVNEPTEVSFNPGKLAYTLGESRDHAETLMRENDDLKATLQVYQGDTSKEQAAAWGAEVIQLRKENEDHRAEIAELKEELKKSKNADAELVKKAQEAEKTWKKKIAKHLASRLETEITKAISGAR